MGENEATEQGSGGQMWDAPNQQVVRDDASPPWEEGSGGNPEEPVARENGELPGRHAGLDELAAERGVVWSRDDLTVAEKQQELGG